MMIDQVTCPIINTHPDEIYDVLKKCLRGELDLQAIGQSGRSYVKKYYSLEAVAARLGGGGGGGGGENVENPGLMTSSGTVSWIIKAAHVALRQSTGTPSIGGLNRKFEPDAKFSFRNFREMPI